MNTASIAHDKPSVFRNSPLLIAMIFVCAMVGYATVPCFMILAGASWFSAQLTFGLIMEGLSWTCAAWFMGNLGWSLWRLTFSMARNRAQLDQNGVHFQIAKAKMQDVISFPWGEITAVLHKRAGTTQQYTVVGSGGRMLQFTGYTFFRPRKLARQIALRAGIAIQEK